MARPALVLLLLAAPAAAQFECSFRGFDPPSLRNRGQSELLGDLVLACQGIRPGQGISANITVTLNTPVTSRILNAGNNASEALLLLDDPAPSDQLPKPAGAAVPSANVIQGVQSGSTSILFVDVPFLAPGPQGFVERIVRIVNLRANVSALAAGAEVTATVSFAGNLAVNIAPSTRPLGQVARPLDFTVRTPDDSGPYGVSLNACAGNNLNVTPQSARDFNIRFSETFPSEFRERNIATSPNNWFAVGDQNDPSRGILNYGTETGFLNSGFPQSTGMNQAGLATQGTRLMARFSGIPSGATLFVTAQPVGQGTSGTGVTARLTNTGDDGSGPFSERRALLGPYVQLSVIAGEALAVWEVFDANAVQLETISFGVIVSIPAGTLQSSVLRIAGLNAPVPGPGVTATPAFTAAGVDQRAATDIRGCASQLTILTPCPIEAASAGVPFSRPLTAAGGTPPYVWSVASGSLPPGVTLSPSGLLAGTATQAGSFPFQLRVTDAAGASATQNCSLAIQPALSISTACPLPDATLGSAYTQTLNAVGGVTPYVWTLARGALPNGLVLARAGTISGTPTASGIFSFALQVTDARLVAGQKECSIRVQAPLRVGPTSLTFIAPAGSGPTAPQTISLLNEPAGQAWALRVLTESGGDWLRVTPTNGRIPGLIEVTAVPGFLREGVYSGSVTIVTQGQSQQSLGVLVTLEVRPARPARLAVQPPGFTIAVPRGSARLDRAFLLANSGSGSIPYELTAEVADGGRWLGFSNISGRVSAGAPVRVPLSISPGDLSPGAYRAHIRIVNEEAPETLFVPVTLVVGTSADAMAVEPLALSLNTTPGGALPAHEIAVLATGAGPVNWQASAAVEPGVPQWLSIAPVTGRAVPGTPSRPEIRVNTAGLAPGRYLGEVTINAPGIENSPRVVLVRLTLEAANENPVRISPPNLLFTTTPGVASSRQFVTLINAGRNPFTFDADLVGDSAVFSVSQPSARLIAPGARAQIEVSANAGRVTQGVTSARLNIQTSADSTVRQVELAFAVNPGLRPNAAAQNEPGPRIDAVCPPGGLRVFSLAVGNGFRAAPGEPLPMDVGVFESNGAPVTSGFVSASLGGRVAVLTTVGYGRWVGSLIPAPAETGPAVLSLLAEDRARNLTGCQDLAGVLQPAASPLPVIPDGGVLSTASFQPFAPLAPGGMAAIFGSALAEGSNTAGLPLPGVLGTTRVRLGPAAMPLFFAGESLGLSQVNGIVPYGLAPNVAHQLIINSSAGAATALVPVAAAAPGVFTVNQRGTGQAIAVHGLNPLLLADAANPIPRGGVIVLYLEGLGATSPAVEAGYPAPSDPLASAAAPVRVTIGGLEAEVLFAGLTPGHAGLYQVNAVVPPQAPAGSEVPVVVTAAGWSSFAVTIAVR